MIWTLPSSTLVVRGKNLISNKVSFLLLMACLLCSSFWIGLLTISACSIQIIFLLYLKETLSQPQSASFSQHNSAVSEGDCVSTSMNRNWLWQIVSHDTIYTIKIDVLSVLSIFISSQQLDYYIMYLTFYYKICELFFTYSFAPCEWVFTYSFAPCEQVFT